MVVYGGSRPWYNNLQIWYAHPTLIVESNLHLLIDVMKKTNFLPYDQSRYDRTRDSLIVQYKTFSKNDVKMTLKWR